MTDTDWKQPLANAARQLHDLLREVDAVSNPLWEGDTLKLAALRYEHVFLPMLATHLSAKGIVKLAPAADEHANRLLKAAKARLRKLLVRAKKDEVYKSDRNTRFPPDVETYLAPFNTLGASSDYIKCTPEKVLPIPPLDVAFCWALHRLSPRAYDADCEILFGTRLPAMNGAGLAYVCVRNASAADSAVARLQWDCFARAARAAGQRPTLAPQGGGSFPGFLGKVVAFAHKVDKRLTVWPLPISFRTFLPVYLWPRYRNEKGVVLKQTLKNQVPQQMGMTISYNLFAAARRQKEFLYNVSTPYYETRIALDRGVARYEKFLRLMRQHPKVFVVPLYDIDLVWHAHLLRDSDIYARDCEKVVGHFVNHVEDDDRSADSKQQDGYKRTMQLWVQEYGEVYADEHTNYRGKAPAEARVYMDGKIIDLDVRFRDAFVNSVVCRKCNGKKAADMKHKDCVDELRKKIRIVRAGHAQGGACGALFASGFVGCSTLSSSCAMGGGACGGFANEGGAGAGCGNGGGACGANAIIGANMTSTVGFGGALGGGCGFAGGCGCGGGGCGGC